MLNLLLIEDEDLDVLAFNRALGHARIPHRLAHAPDGEAALQLLRDRQLPRSNLLILLDLEMPRMNGFAFLDALREDPTLVSIPVLVLTGSNDDQHRRMAHARNCGGYFTKPADFEELVQLCRDIERYWSKSQYAP